MVNKGLLEVLGGPNGDTLLTELQSGSSFGEIRYVSSNLCNNNNYYTLYIREIFIG